MLGNVSPLLHCKTPSQPPPISCKAPPHGTNRAHRQLQTGSCELLISKGNGPNKSQMVNSMSGKDQTTLQEVTYSHFRNSLAPIITPQESLDLLFQPATFVSQPTAVARTTPCDGGALMTTRTRFLLRNSLTLSINSPKTPTLPQSQRVMIYWLITTV